MDSLIKRLQRLRNPDYRECPTCKRQIEVLDGKWTQHTNPTGWSMREPLEQCEMAGRTALQSQEPTP